MSEQLIQTPGVFGDNGNFLLERELGSGGMGGVYMGRDKMLDRPVAVKVMLKELGSDAEFVEKFKKEAQAAARLIHPNIVQVYSYGISEGMPYIAMELAAGGSLYSLMNATPGKTDIQRVLKICQQTALALQCSSDQGVVHGDVKPENILLDANGNAKLVDFGLAAMQKETDEIWGTPYYISPEKVKKEVVDFRSDMYSLGGTLYHALTGSAPFEGDDSVAVVKKRFEGVPRKPSEIRPEITPAVDTLVMKMIALEREDRYPSFEALVEAFKEVLATGLTQKMEHADASSGTKSATTTATRPGVRRTRMTVRKAGTGVKPLVKKPADDGKEIPPVEAEEEEDEGGNLGAKVALFVVGGILAIAAVAGGLFWFISANARAQEAEHQAQVVSKIREARKSIENTRDMAVKFDQEFKEFAQRATDECTKYTAELQKLLPDYASSMKPAISDELRKAIALTNTVVEVAATNAAPVAVAPVSPAKTEGTAKADSPTPAKRLTLQEEAKKYGLPPPPEDFDPADPANEDFLNKLKEARAKAKEAAAAKTAEKPVSAPTTPTAPAEGAKAEPPPMALKDIADLWERAYSCQACQIKISIAVKKVLATCAKADELQGESEAIMTALADLSNEAKGLYDQMTASQDVVTVRKGITFIKSKGDKTVKQTIRELTIKKAEADRVAAAARQKALEEQRLAKIASEKAALIEKETTEIAAKFDAIAAQGCFRQLDWKSALRQLEQASEGFKTPEGDIAKNLQLKKVNSMKRVQDIFIAKLKGYVFKGKLKGYVVIAIDEREITIQRPDRDKNNKQRKPIKIAWQKFYAEYPGNFNEIINHFIVLGRKYSGLNLRDWADTMAGAALTMRLVCSEVNGATAKAEELAKEVVKQFPEYEKTIKEIFPDITFEASTEE